MGVDPTSKTLLARHTLLTWGLLGATIILIGRLFQLISIISLTDQVDRGVSLLILTEGGAIMWADGFISSIIMKSRA